MIPTETEIIKLHKKYAKSETHFKRMFVHGEIVALIAASLAGKIDKDVDLSVLRSSCLLHDVGAYMFMDEAGKIDKSYYQLHPMVGSKILEEEGVDKRICRIVIEHQLLALPEGYSAPIPEKNYLPKSIESRLLNYADRYHSKVPVFNSVAFLRSKLKDYQRQSKIFEAWVDEFGLPDVNEFAKKFNQGIR